jgi:hypothetical protein
MLSVLNFYRGVVRFDEGGLEQVLYVQLQRSTGSLSPDRDDLCVAHRRHSSADD